VQFCCAFTVLLRPILDQASDTQLSSSLLASTWCFDFLCRWCCIF
jgi:hypothetical protein